MSPLERRYRRLLRLLPRQHRAARGEELLGLLLDLDDGRSRPSARQALGLIGLAIRLRLAVAPADGSVPFSAFLVVFGTTSIAQLVVDYAYAATSPARPYLYPTAIVAIVLASALAQFGAVVAWVLGARRAALLFQGTVVVADFGGPMVLVAHTRYGLATAFELLNLDVTTLSSLPQLAMVGLLAVAVRRRWSTPRPRPLWLAAVAQALLAWAFIDVVTRNHHLPPAYAGWVLAAGGAAIAAILARRRHWPVFVVSVLIGAGIGTLLSLALPHPRYGSLSWVRYESLSSLAAIALGTAFLVGCDRFLTRQLTDRPARQPVDQPP